jgi:hypothetical protein
MAAPGAPDMYQLVSPGAHDMYQHLSVEDVERYFTYQYADVTTWNAMPRPRYRHHIPQGDPLYNTLTWCEDITAQDYAVRSHAKCDPAILCPIIREAVEGLNTSRPHYIGFVFDHLYTVTAHHGYPDIFTLHPDGVHFDGDMGSVAFHLYIITELENCSSLSPGTDPFDAIDLLVEHVKVVETQEALGDWRPWTAETYNTDYRHAMRTLLLLAKAPGCASFASVPP